MPKNTKKCEALILRLPIELQLYRKVLTRLIFLPARSEQFVWLLGCTALLLARNFFRALRFCFQFFELARSYKAWLRGLNRSLFHPDKMTSIWSLSVWGQICLLPWNYVVWKGIWSESDQRRCMACAKESSRHSCLLKTSGHSSDP